MGFKTGYVNPNFKKFFFYDTSNERTANYKDVNEVTKVSNELGIGNLVARLKPLAVVKG